MTLLLREAGRARLALGLALLWALAPIVAHASSVPASALPAVSSVASSDLFPDQPNGSSQLQVATAAQIAAYVAGSGSVVASVAGVSGVTCSTSAGAVTCQINLGAANSFTALQTFGAGANVTPAATPATNAVGYLGAPEASGGAINANKTLSLTDAGELQYYTGSTGYTVTIPANASVAFPIGTVIPIVNDSSASQTLAITSDTLEWEASTGSRTLAPNAVVSLIKVSSTVWRITGTDIS